MKLGALKSALRGMTGSPKVMGNYADIGVALTLVVQKGPLLEELDRVFGGDRNRETGLWLRDDGLVLSEAHRTAAVPADDEDLIG